MNFEEYREFNKSIDLIGKYFSYLRKKKRGNLHLILDKSEIDKFKNIDKEMINKLIHKHLLKHDYLCSICHRCYDVIETYYEQLPLIFNFSDTDSTIIEIVCSECREEAIEKLLKKEL